MRSDEVVIGGVKYAVKGLSVSQSLTTDLEAFDARQSKNRPALTDLRLRRMAMALQNGGAYIPDLNSPIDPDSQQRKGSIQAVSLTVDQVMKWLDSDVFLDMVEFYDAEKVCNALADPVKADGAKGAGTGEGESPATE